MQFAYLSSHGLEQGHNLLEIGCGNLRAGWRFIAWLDVGAYTGVDISPEILLAANQTLVQRRLQSKQPRLMLYDGFDLGFIPGNHFDAAHAHSVFSHTPIEVVSRLLGEVWRVLKPGGFFDFTYNRSDTGEVWGFLNEDYYYPTETLIELAGSLGYEASPAEDWRYKQEKIRAVKPVSGSTDDD
jgi:ubiquinone/menaquinone biosynthesis C-methylase UbiE